MNCASSFTDGVTSPGWISTFFLAIVHINLLTQVIKTLITNQLWRASLPNRVLIHDMKREGVEPHGEVQSVLFTPKRIKVLPHCCSPAIRNRLLLATTNFNSINVYQESTKFNNQLLNFVAKVSRFVCWRGFNTLCKCAERFFRLKGCDFFFFFLDNLIFSTTHLIKTQRWCKPHYFSPKNSFNTDVCKYI